MSPETPSSPEKNWLRERLNELMEWVGIGGEKQEVKDQLDILFDAQKSNEERARSLLFFRNKFFPEGIENGKPVKIQLDWAKDIDKRLDAILDQRGIAYFVPDKYPFVVFKGNVFSKNKEKKGYWHEQEELPLAHGMEIAFYEENPSDFSDQQKTVSPHQREEEEVLTQSNLPKSVQRLKREFLVRQSGEVKKMPEGGTISGLFPGNFPSAVFYVDDKGNVTEKQPRNIDVGDFVWIKKDPKGTNHFFYSEDAANCNLDLDFAEHGELLPLVLKEKADVTRHLSKTYMLLGDKKNKKRFQNLNPQRKAEYQNKYRPYYKLLDTYLGILEQDRTLYNLNPSEFDEICTEARREISRRMFAKMPGEDFSLLRNFLKETLGSNQEIDNKLAAYMGTHTRPYERKMDFYRNPEVADAIKEASRQTGVPVDWITKVIIIESEGDQFAYSGFAFGLMGLKYDVFQGYGSQRAKESALTFEHTINPANAQESILRGARYLKALKEGILKSGYYKKNKDRYKLNLEHMTMQAYNMGPTAMRNLLNEAETNGTDYRSSLSEETKKYVGQIQDWPQSGKNTLPKILQYLES